MIDPATRVENANERYYEHYAESEEERRVRLDYERERRARPQQGDTRESCPSCGRPWGTHALTCRRGGGIYNAGDPHLDT